MSRHANSGFDFPCEYAIKAVGLAEHGFTSLVLDLVGRHCPIVREDKVSVRSSRNGKYVSVTISIQADSREQLDAIYAELTAHDKILMRL